MKESDGFVLLPGGFGTLDEAFELLTLLQTGKAQPAPIVLLDVPGGTYWQTWQAFVDRGAGRTPATSRRDDLALVLHHRRRRRRGRRGHPASTRNYHSLRFVDGRLVLRMQRAPTRERARGAERASSPTSSCAGAIETHRRDAPPRSPTATTSTSQRLGVLVRPPQLGAPARADRPPQRPPGS